MPKAISLILIIVGLIHLLPVTGVLGAGKLYGLYGVAIGYSNLELLMRHRAVLFGLLGTFLIYAAFNPVLYRHATLAGLVSAVSFIVLAYTTTTHYNHAVGTIIAVDIVAATLLLIAVILLLTDKPLGVNYLR